MNPIILPGFSFLRPLIHPASIITALFIPLILFVLHQLQLVHQSAIIISSLVILITIFSVLYMVEKLYEISLAPFVNANQYLGLGFRRWVVKENCLYEIEITSQGKEVGLNLNKTNLTLLPGKHKANIPAINIFSILQVLTLLAALFIEDKISTHPAFLPAWGLVLCLLLIKTVWLHLTWSKKKSELGAVLIQSRVFEAQGAKLVKQNTVYSIHDWCEEGIILKEII